MLDTLFAKKDSSSKWTKWFWIALCGAVILVVAVWLYYIRRNAAELAALRDLAKLHAKDERIKAERTPLQEDAKKHLVEAAEYEKEAADYAARLLAIKQQHATILKSIGSANTWDELEAL